MSTDGRSGDLPMPPSDPASGHNEEPASNPQAENERDECAFCLDIIEDVDACCSTNCPHESHRHCLLRWLAQKRTCATCRTQVIAVRMSMSGELVPLPDLVVAPPRQFMLSTWWESVRATNLTDFMDDDIRGFNTPQIFIRVNERRTPFQEDDQVLPPLLLRAGGQDEEREMTWTDYHNLGSDGRDQAREETFWWPVAQEEMVVEEEEREQEEIEHLHEEEEIEYEDEGEEYGSVIFHEDQSDDEQERSRAEVIANLARLSSIVEQYRALRAGEHEVEEDREEAASQLEELDEDEEVHLPLVVVDNRPPRAVAREPPPWGFQTERPPWEVPENHPSSCNCMRCIRQRANPAASQEEREHPPWSDCPVCPRHHGNPETHEKEEEESESDGSLVDADHLDDVEEECQPTQPHEVVPWCNCENCIQQPTNEEDSHEDDHPLWHHCSLCLQLREATDVSNADEVLEDEMAGQKDAETVNEEMKECTPDLREDSEMERSPHTQQPSTSTSSAAAPEYSSSIYYASDEEIRDEDKRASELSQLKMFAGRWFRASMEHASRDTKVALRAAFEQALCCPDAMLRGATGWLPSIDRDEPSTSADPERAEPLIEEYEGRTPMDEDTKLL